MAEEGLRQLDFNNTNHLTDLEYSEAIKVVYSSDELRNITCYCDEVAVPIVRIQAGNTTKIVYIQYIYNIATLLNTTLTH